MSHPNEECKDLGPIILFFVIFEAMCLQMTFIFIRLVFCKPRTLHFFGILETFLAFCVIGYFKLVPTCDMFLS